MFELYAIGMVIPTTKNFLAFLDLIPEPTVILAILCTQQRCLHKT